MRPKKPLPERSHESTLPFDVTQEIDPGLLEDLFRKPEPTLTQTDFDDVTVVLPEKLQS